MKRPGHCDTVTSEENGPKLPQNTKRQIGSAFVWDIFNHRDSSPRFLEKSLDAFQHADRGKCGAAEVVNQSQRLQAVDRHGTDAEDARHRAVSANERPVDRNVKGRDNPLDRDGSYGGLGCQNPYGDLLHFDQPFTENIIDIG